MTATTKHTPGPWKVWKGQSVMPRVIVSGDGSSVADANAGFPCSEEEQDANARLIAAAPELLHACKALVAMEAPSRPGQKCAYCNSIHCDTSKCPVALASIAIATAGGAA